MCIRDRAKDLVSMGFITEDGRVTNAGLLLCDQGYLKQSKVVCNRWTGTEKGSVEGDALDDEMCIRDSYIGGFQPAAERGRKQCPFRLFGI